MAVFNPNRRHNARGEQRRLDLLRAAAVVFARLGYHDTTTNAIAAEAGVSPATLYQFFPNKDAIASALTESYAREMAQSERAIDPEGTLSASEAITRLLDTCIAFNRERPEFHTLVLDAPLSDAARQEKQALSNTFIDFIAARLRRESPALSRADANHHAGIALLIFRGILDAMPSATPSHRRRLQTGMREAILRYLQPFLR